ncbi:hypothetical protein FCOIX_4442 [Fusarium coicis]|nr:hypothetical protein FCOIX_4442 [Fusarium coicis]
MGTAPPCENSCIFGISNPCPGINPGDIRCVFRNSSSYLVTGGRQGRVYWFRFQKLQEKLHCSAIPRYSEKNLQKALSDSADDNILPDLKFSTLVDNKVSAVMTPLVEYVYKQWHFDRIVTLGSPSGRLTTVQVESMFADIQSRRRPSLALSHRYSHYRANTEALDTPLKKLMAIHLLPLVDEQVVTLGYCSQHLGGEMLDMLPVQHHESLIPYKQELLCEPVSRGSIQWVLVVAYAVFAVIADSARKYGPTPTNRSISHNYWTDKPSISSLESLKFNAFSHIIQPIAFIMIEGYRGRNKLKPLALPALWLILIQYAGIGVTMPLYYLVYTLLSDVESYWWPLRRFVPLRYARHILSAVSLAVEAFGTLCYWFAVMQAVRNVDLNMILNVSWPTIVDESLHILTTQHDELFLYSLASYVWTVQAAWDFNRVGRANMNLFIASFWILLALNDPSKIQPGGSVDEKLCKIREIEKDLGRIQGVMETLWVAGDFIMTIPLSFLAEKWGRRAILRLNLVSRSFMLLWAIIVGSFDTLLPTKAIVVGSVLSVLGGDCVFNSLTYGLVSNLTNDHVQRAIYFGYMSSVSYVVALLGPALASSTMTVSLWLPFWLGMFLLSLAIPTIQMLPTQNHANERTDGDDESQHEPLLSSPRIKAQSHHEPLIQSVIGRLHTIKTIIVRHPKNFSLLLFSFLLTSLASSDTKLLVQYISARYKWTFASAGYLLSGKAIVNFTLLTIVIPKLLRSARQVRQEDAAEVADKSNIWNAMYCLIASVFGALGIALASEIWMLIPSMFVYALGSALPIFTLSLLKSPVISPPHSSDSSDPEPHIFSIVMLVKTVGSLIGAPLMAALWVRGLGIGGMALGMPFFVSQACYAVAIWVFVNIEVDSDVLATAERRRRSRD